MSSVVPSSTINVIADIRLGMFAQKFAACCLFVWQDTPEGFLSSAFHCDFTISSLFSWGFASHFFHFPDVVCERYGEPHHCASPFYALTAFWFRFSNFEWKTTTSGCFSTWRKRNFVSYQETEKVRSAGGDCSNKFTSNSMGVIFLMSLQALEQGVDEDEFSPSGENRFFQSNRKRRSRKHIAFHRLHLDQPEILAFHNAICTESVTRRLNPQSPNTSASRGRC